MHSNTFMPGTLIIGYKNAFFWQLSSVLPTFLLRMNVRIGLCLLIISNIFADKIDPRPYYIPADFYNEWVVVRRTSEGQLYFSPDIHSRRIFAWKPYNGSIPPTFFYNEDPEILQDRIPSTTSGNPQGTFPEDTLGNHESTFQKVEETISSTSRSGLNPVDAPRTAALELPPSDQNQETQSASPRSLGMNVLHHSMKLAKLMDIMSKERSTPNLEPPAPRNITLNDTLPSPDIIVNAEEIVDLTKESTQSYAVRREKLRIKRQISPDVATELDLNDAQMSNMQAQVDRRFLVGYDCANPQEVKPISSFVQDPCEPSPTTEPETFKASEIGQYQIVQYETRREIKGTRCEKHVSQFTYYCGTADHASPYPQETFYRRPKILRWNECKELASIGQYVAGDGRMYEIPINTRTEIPYFAFGSASAYVGIEGNQITCTGGTIKVDGKDIHHMVMFITEEILYREEKLIVREDEDGVIAHYDNVRLTCPFEDAWCVGGDTTYVWRIPTKKHCPLYHVRNFVGQIAEHEIAGLTIQAKKVVMSTDQSHVRFIIKGEKNECDQNFYTTNYQDLMVRKIMVDGVVDRNLVKRKLPKDELKLSNFITNRDDYVFHSMTRSLQREFSSVIRDECRENLRKTKTEHFLERQMPGLHTYRLGGANYLTAAGEVAYFYKCRPRLVAAIRADTCYDALPVEIANENDTLTSYYQIDGKSAVVPKHYLEPLTHRLTSVAKKTPCISKFFARYQDVFGQWFAVTPALATTDAPETLDLDIIRKRVLFSDALNVDLSRGGVYDPDAVDDLITYLEDHRRQEVVLHQITEQVGIISPGEYITPRAMFPPHTLPGGSWHTFILGKLWGAIRGLGEIFSSIFGLLIVGRLVWYLIKVLMNCSYIHSVHGCSAQLAWSFCTEVFFTRLYRRGQSASDSERDDNDPSSKPKRSLNIGNIFNFRGKPNRASEGPWIEDPEGTAPVPMYPMPTLRRSQSVTQIRNKHTDSTDPGRLQSQLNQAIAAFQPFSHGTSTSPPPPDYVNDPMVGTPLDATKTKPSAPVTTSEVAHGGDAVPPLPVRVNQTTGPIGPRNNRTPTRFAFTPIPTPRADTPPVPTREPVIRRPSRDGTPSLPSR